METGLKKFFADFENRMAQADLRAEKTERRIDLSIRRLVKLESRAEAFDKKLELSISNLGQASKNLEQTNKNLEQTNKNLVQFGKKLEKSIKDQEAFSEMQSKMNQYFLTQIKKNGHK